MGKQVLITTAAVAILAAAATAASVGDKRPVGPAPRSIVVDKVEAAKGQVSCLETIAKLVLEERTAVRRDSTGNFDLIAYAMEAELRLDEDHPVQKTRLLTLSLKPGEVYSLSGKKLEEKEAWKRLRKGTTILISTDGKPVDAVHLKKANPDTIVLVPVKSILVPPLPPKPIPIREP